MVARLEDRLGVKLLMRMTRGWMFAPEIADGAVKVVLRDWELPRIDLWAVFPAGPTATTKACTFTEFVREVMRVPSGASSETL